MGEPLIDEGSVATEALCEAIPALERSSVLSCHSLSALLFINSASGEVLAKLRAILGRDHGKKAWRQPILRGRE